MPETAHLAIRCRVQWRPFTSKAADWRGPVSGNRQRRARSAAVIVAMVAISWLGGAAGRAATPANDPAGARPLVPATPAADLSCADFASEADAQRVLDADPSDPNG